MIRSLYSGVSGMKNHQIRMDVIANNIANVNTMGYKGSRANFQDILYQTVRYASAAVDNVGGINPSQVGLGMMVSSITNNINQGGLQATGRTLDLAINGNGWFVLSPNGESVDPTASPPTGLFTREGIFYIDNAGNVVNSSGYNLCDAGGAPIRLEAGAGISSINISKDGWISYTTLDGTVNSNAFQIGLAMFPNQEGLERVGQNMFKGSPTSGSGFLGTPNTGGYGSVNSGYLEMSNVDLTDEFASMITTQRGYQASARTITTSDQMLVELLDLRR